MPNWNLAGFFRHIINFAVRISEATMRQTGDIIVSAWFFLYLFAERISETAMGRTGVWGHMINMTIRELLYYTFVDFPKLEFLFIILIFPKGTAELRWGGGGGGIIYFLGSSVAKLGSSVAQ